jgi:predicted  nucleic acid-binding Zn-ribbon protein
MALAQLLDQEQLKTQRLLEELRTVKSTNATEIRRLKKELATLRKVMIGYINQIDSLNKLTAEVKRAKKPPNSLSAGQITVSK